MYGNDAWSLRLKDENRVRFFENSRPRKIFRPKWVDVKGNWQHFCEKFRGFISSPHYFVTIKQTRMRWTGLVARIVD